MLYENRDWKVKIDELTGLYNRTSFYHIAREMIEENEKADYTIVISDIESFKVINSRYGEEKGDNLLRYIGESLKALNSKDICFARYSGDQFVGIIRQPELLAGQVVDSDDQRLMENMDYMYKHAPISRFEVKFGIYDQVDKSLPISIMCDRAIMALRTIKHQYGKTIARFDIEMQQQYFKEQRILESMEIALKEEQFQVYYQPKHDCATGALVGAEALIRWNHPEYGFMSPMEFIPLFEKNGFISQVDYYVAKKVIESQRKWFDMGFKLVPISINASLKDLLHKNFIPSIRSLLQTYNLDPSFIHMEITESLFIEDIDYLHPIIETIRNSGINVELDDFGSGFSALSLLTILPLDIIKLDMSFIRNIIAQKLVVESIIHICHGLGCKMIAEGVETKEQLDILNSMGCDIVQGYYYSKPLPVKNFENYMRKQG